MGRRDGGGGRIPVHGETPRGGGTSLGDLLAKAGLVKPADVAATGPTAGPQTPGPRPAAKAGLPDLATCPKVVVRRERKGHGGRTVTRLEGLDLPEADLEALAREAGRALGCGGRLEDGVPVVQGDPGDRLEAWLRERGARKVVRGN